MYTDMSMRMCTHITVHMHVCINKQGTSRPPYATTQRITEYTSIFSFSFPSPHACRFPSSFLSRPPLPHACRFPSRWASARIFVQPPKLNPFRSQPTDHNTKQHNTKSTKHTQQKEQIRTKITLSLPAPFLSPMHACMHIYLPFARSLLHDTRLLRRYCHRCPCQPPRLYRQVCAWLCMYVHVSVYVSICMCTCLYTCLHACTDASAYLPRRRICVRPMWACMHIYHACARA